MEKYVPDLGLDRHPGGMGGITIDVWINGTGGKATVSQMAAMSRGCSRVSPTSAVSMNSTFTADSS